MASSIKAALPQGITMNSYVIDLSDETCDLLKERASAHGVSIEEEVNAVLDAWYRNHFESIVPDCEQSEICA
jgi:hypothetical protein